VAPPFRQAEVDLMFDGGISREADLLTLGAEDDIVDKAGAWYSYKGTRLGQGKEASRIYLMEHPEASDEIELALFAKHLPQRLEERQAYLAKAAEIRAAAAATKS